MVTQVPRTHFKSQGEAQIYNRKKEFHTVCIHQGSRGITRSLLSLSSAGENLYLANCLAENQFGNDLYEDMHLKKSKLRSSNFNTLPKTVFEWREVQ